MERQDLIAQGELARAVSLLHLRGAGASHDLDQVRGHGQAHGAATQHHHLGDGGRQGQHQGEGGASACRGARFDPSAHGVDFGADHVHANASACQFGDLIRGREPWREDELGELTVRGLIARRHQAQTLGALADALQVEARAVIGHLDGHFVALLAQADRDLPTGRLAGCGARVGHFDAMGHTVAQQVLEGPHHPLQDATVHLGVAAHNVQAHLLAGFLTCQSHHAVQAVGQAFELHHARAQQIVLQIAGETGLGGQLVFGCLQVALQGALHGGHVVHRLGHHAGQFLEARVAVELQRVEILTGGTGCFQLRAHLGFGLQLDVAQVMTQAVQVVCQVGQRAADLLHLRLQTGAGDGHFARMVDQAIQQLRTHPHSRLRHHGVFRRGRGDHGFAGAGGELGPGHRRRIDRRRRHRRGIGRRRDRRHIGRYVCHDGRVRQFRGGLDRQVIADLKRRRQGRQVVGRGHTLGLLTAQGLEHLDELVHAGFQRGQLFGAHAVLRQQTLDG